MTDNEVILSLLTLLVSNEGQVVGFNVDKEECCIIDELLDINNYEMKIATK